MVTVAPPVAPSHARDLLGWHALSAGAMLVMLVVTIPGWLAGAAAAVFAGGLVWCVAHAVRLRPRAAHLRLGVCCLAMLAMLVPLAGAEVPGLGAGGHSRGAHSMQGPSMAHSAGPGLLALLLAGVLVCVAASGLVRGLPSSAGVRARATGLTEAVLAAGMAAMLVGAV